MTKQQLTRLGFKRSKQYEHDGFRTSRYVKGILEVELTYIGDRLLTCDLAISELFCKPVTFEEIKAITPILGGVECYS